jgi:hypothetical protein
MPSFFSLLMVKRTRIESNARVHPETSVVSDSRLSGWRRELGRDKSSVLLLSSHHRRGVRRESGDPSELVFRAELATSLTICSSYDR